MAAPVLASIVEGYGEVEALPVLLRALLPAWRIARPIRVQRQRVVQEGVLERYLLMARASVQEGVRGAVLVLLDADEELPCVLAPQLLVRVRACLPELACEVVLARRTYEAWLVAGLEWDPEPERAPEDLPSPTAFLKARLGRYKKTADQPGLTARLDPERARERSASFDKLLRALAAIDDRVRPEGS